MPLWILSRLSAGKRYSFSLARVRGNTPVLPFISLFSCNYSGFLIPGYYCENEIFLFFLLIHAVAMKIAAALGV